MLLLFFLFLLQLFVVLYRCSDLIDEKVCDVFDVEVDCGSAFHFVVCITVSNVRNDEITVGFGWLDFFLIAWLNLTKVFLNWVLQHLAILNGVFVNSPWASHVGVRIDENSQVHDVVYLWLRAENVRAFNADDFDWGDFDFLLFVAFFNLYCDLVA